MITNRRNLVRFPAYVRPYRRRMALSTLVGVIKYYLPVAFPWILKEAVDGVLAGRPGRTGWGLNQLMRLAVLIFTAYAGITYLRTYIADRLSNEMIFDLRSDLFKRLQRLPVDFFQRYRKGVVSARLITDVNMAQRFSTIVKADNNCTCSRHKNLCFPDDNTEFSVFHRIRRST